MGVRDTKHLSEKIRKHENTRAHMNNYLKLGMLGRTMGKWIKTDTFYPK